MIRSEGSSLRLPGTTPSQNQQGSSPKLLKKIRSRVFMDEPVIVFSQVVDMMMLDG
jgi:hypothetical protein